MDQPGKVANPDRGQLNRELNIPLSPCVPENLVSRDGFSHTQAESGAYLRERVTTYGSLFVVSVCISLSADGPNQRAIAIAIDGLSIPSIDIDTAMLPPYLHVVTKDLPISSQFSPTTLFVYFLSGCKFSTLTPFWTLLPLVLARYKATLKTQHYNSSTY